jgi:DNA polymerase elongation subunit (family B)
MFLDLHFLKRCLFIDIETVSEVGIYAELPQHKKELWSIKATHIRKYSTEDNSKTDEELYKNKAGIFSEFAKIVCISMGFLGFDGDEPNKIRIKSLAGENENTLLNDFVRILTNHYSDPENSRIAGHNIKEFDIPFICRRLVIHQIKFPILLDISGKKPWQTAHILDTMDMWRFGDYKNYTSLSLLAGTLGIISPKDDIDGSMVSYTFWVENDLERIITYCQKDVITVIQIMMRFAGQDLFSDEQVEYINQKLE